MDAARARLVPSLEMAGSDCAEPLESRVTSTATYFDDSRANRRAVGPDIRFASFMQEEKFMSQETILVTGAAGSVGRVHACLSASRRGFTSASTLEGAQGVGRRRVKG